MRKSIFLLVLVSLVFTNCNKKEDTPELPDINIVDISQESEWDYCVFGKQDYYFIKTKNSIPEAVLFHSSEANKDYSIFFTNSGFLDKVVIDDFIFSFKNPVGNKIDIGIIYPDGQIEILREVETEYDWENYSLKSASSIEEWSDVIRWTGRVVAGVPCAVSVGLAVASVGITAPQALWTCGNYLLGLSADIMENEFEIHNGFTDVIDTYGAVSAIGSCGGLDYGLSCVSEVISRGFSNWANDREEIEERRDEARAVDAFLEYGYGDVQINLTWDNNADLDLYVIDPNGEQIYWKHKYSSSGGVLDVDNTIALGPENIYWAEDEAPDGNYEVYIHHYDWENSSRPSTSNYQVVVDAFGVFKIFSGSIARDEVIHITDFDQNGLKSAQIGNFKITIENKK